MKEVNANAEALKRNFLELTELRHILRKTQVFFEEVSFLFIWQIGTGHLFGLVLHFEKLIIKNTYW